MSLLFETILIKECRPVNLKYHEVRFNNARKHFWNMEPIPLADSISPSGLDKKVLYRCRVDYERDIESVTISKYTPRKISSLKIVIDDIINYEYKFADRKRIDELLLQKETADDILIIRKGLVTDTSIGNIVLSKKGKYYTPAAPLLKGTQRSFLIDSGIVEETDITKDVLYSFDSWQFINALNPFVESRFNPVNKILL